MSSRPGFGHLCSPTSRQVETIRSHYPDIQGLDRLSDESRLVVSEPLGDLAGVWNEVPASSYGVIRGGDDELGTFCRN